MKTSLKPSVFVTAVGLICLVSPARSDEGFRLSTGVDATTSVKSLSVRVDVGEHGDDLDEPIALDLGVGFPLLLCPSSSVDQEDNLSDTANRFGAIAQSTTANGPIRVGSSATFTFEVENDKRDLDRLGTTAQLLKELTLSDISRIGFISLGDCNWELAGYEIKVNDQPFAENLQASRKAGDARDAARQRLGDLQQEIEPFTTQIADLEALREAELAMSEDLDLLAELREQAQPLQQEVTQLKKQLDGRYPWFIESEFRPAWRSDSKVQSAKVTLVTANEVDAGTRDRVYFQTGGHKYLLASAEQMLDSAFGPQSFDLDLDSGPLTAADIRGFAVGMLAEPVRGDTTPDYWRADRVLVEVDGSVVYDSEEYPLDRRSLKAVRVISPYHLDQDGHVVDNREHTDWETFVWQAGKGIGLGEDGQPGSSDEPPPSIPDPGGPSGGEPDFPDPASPLPDDPPPVAGGVGGTGGDLPGSDFPDDPYFPPGYDPSPGGEWPPIDWPPSYDVPPVTSTFDPPQDGPTPVVTDVRFTQGWRIGDDFKVRWNVSGDETQVAGYNIEVIAFYPDQPNPEGFVFTTVDASPGDREVRLAFPSPPLGSSKPYFILPRVVAQLADGGFTDDKGPVRPIFPAGADPDMKLSLSNGYSDALEEDGDPNTPTPIHPVSVGQPPNALRGAWTFEREQTQLGYEFEMPLGAPVRNAAYRGPSEMPLVLHSVGVFHGKDIPLRATAHVGFLGEPNGVNGARFALRYRVYGPLPGGLLAPPIVDNQGTAPTSTVTTISNGGPAPMGILDELIQVPGKIADNDEFLVHVEVRVTGGNLDLDRPPAVLGLRVVPESP